MGIGERLGDGVGDGVTVVRILLHLSSDGSRAICSVPQVVAATFKRCI